MKKLNFIWLFVLLLHCTNGFLLQMVSHLLGGPECMTLTQLLRSIQISCNEQRHNKTLWSQIIECHRPMTDEFMRTSSEALCPSPKHVQNTTDERFSIEEVFFNVCGIVAGPVETLAGHACITFGRGTLPSHADEVKEVKRRWGQDLPCNIGKCTKQLGLNLGL
ncbi:uncharacterized protein LOC119083545 [Bradysia coprophila]|uniref:uncharacterized protein LOC119083545 n=1 Tax=Bradysia coprophila TaxID=38358 RepID=UPI00187DC416|nr:uncharacterized protein LOC119083545 [Bradysia coprophila]